MTAITCHNLTKTYGKTQALNQLNCTIPSGALTGLIGRNGAGKTTLLKCIAGYYYPTAGTIEVFGRNPYDDLTVSAGLIFVDDTMSFPEDQNLAQLLAIAAKYYANWDQALAEKLLAHFDLLPNKQPKQLSKGMLSTFRSILGICAHAPLTIMDEPTNGMDAGVRKDFYRALLKDYLAHPRTIIISSHLLNEIEDILENILLIDKGHELLCAPVTKLQHYAITLQGQVDALSPFLQQRTVLHQEQSLPNYMTVTVVNDFTEHELAQLEGSTITCASLSASDLCIYLTANDNKGGIDHVFA